MKKLDYTASALLLLLGVVHTLMTLVFYPSIDLAALWFAGTGLGFVFLGLFNLARVRSVDRGIAVLALVANLLAAFYSILLAMALGEVQAYLSVLTLLVLVVLASRGVRQ